MFEGDSEVALVKEKVTLVFVLVKANTLLFLWGLLMNPLNSKASVLQPCL